MSSLRSLAKFIIVSLIGFAAAAGRTAAEEAPGSGQPANRIGLVKDHSPVKYEGYVLYYVEGKLKASDTLTQTWSIVPRKAEGEYEHAFKIETHAIHSDAADGKASFLPQGLFEKDFENSVKYELFHQEEDGDLVLDAIDVDGKPEKIDHETEHYLYPGTLKIGTKWLSEPVTSTLRGPSQMEVVGSEIYTGVNCWVISATRQHEKNPLIKNSETVGKSARFLFDPKTLSVLRIDSVTEGLGPLGRPFKFVYHMEVAE
jgi:hypothetical protein